MSIKVCVTGAAGQIGYSLLQNIGKGEMFGSNQEVVLHLLEIEPCLPALEGVVMELEDCGYPLIKDIIATADPVVAFTDVDAAILVGAFPRKKGMDRKDLLEKNAKIFLSQGKVLNDYAKKDVKVLVVGNPANTNCLICMNAAPDIPRTNFSALTRLDDNRLKAQVAKKLGCSFAEVKNTIIWGNHSKTQYPDVSFVCLNEYDNKELIQCVQNRGTTIIQARGLSSAASAAKAICDHMSDWWKGTGDNEWVSMAVVSDGNPYGIQDGLIYSFPVYIKDREWSIVPDLEISEFSREMMTVTEVELIEEKFMIDNL